MPRLLAVLVAGLVTWAVLPPRNPARGRSSRAVPAPPPARGSARRLRRAQRGLERLRRAEPGSAPVCGRRGPGTHRVGLGGPRGARSAECAWDRVP